MGVQGNFDEPSSSGESCLLHRLRAGLAIESSQTAAAVRQDQDQDQDQQQQNKWTAGFEISGSELVSDKTSAFSNFDLSVVGRGARFANVALAKFAWVAALTAPISIERLFLQLEPRGPLDGRFEIRRNPKLTEAPDIMPLSGTCTNRRVRVVRAGNEEVSSRASYQQE